MERTELAPGLEISRVVTGLWQIADMERSGETLDPTAAAAAMRPYVDAGLTSFDMADHYGSAEEIVGAYDPAGGVPIQAFTKWVPPAGAVTRNDVRDAVERALRRLRTERLDLLQFHAWSYDDPSYLDGLVYLDELRQEGLIGHLGVTNFDAAHLRVVCASGLPVVSNQVCFSLLDRRPLGPMREVCEEYGVKLLAYGTLAGGLLTERFVGADVRAPEAHETWSQMKYSRFVDAAGGWGAYQELLRVIHATAERLGVSMAQVATRWVLDQPAVGAVIVGARLGQSEHIAETRSLHQVVLDDQAHADLAAAGEALEPIPGDSGDEYRRPPFLTASGDLSHHVDEIPVPYVPVERSRRSLVLSGVPWETLAGYSRAVRQGDQIRVSGTTASHGDRLIGGTDPAAQAHFVLDKIEGALRSLGGRLEDVVRTRVYVQNLDQWEPIARAHGQRFGGILPANTLVQAGLIGDEFLVEMEAEAVVGERV